MADSAADFLGLSKPAPDDKSSARNFLGLRESTGGGRKILRGAGKIFSRDLPELPLQHRVVLAAMDNEDEKRAYLEKAFGKGSVSKDKKGLIVKVDGKRMRASEGFWASLGAEAPETVLGIAGAAEGAAAGSPLGPVGTGVGAVAGGAAGAMTGKAVKEAIKSATGLQRKTPAGIAGSVGVAGEGGMFGEMGSRIAGPLASRVTRGSAPSKWFGLTPESKAMTERLTAAGARPHPQSTMPDARRIQRISIIADKISGPNANIDRTNIGYLQDQVEKILLKSGMPKAGRDDVVARLTQTADSKISLQEVGKSIQNTATFMRGGIKSGRQAGATITKYAPRDQAVLDHLSSPRLSPEDAYTWLTAHGEADRLERFVRIMGKNSQVVANLQHQALKNILAGAMERSATGEATEALAQEMAQFTPKQQKLLFPGGLDDDIKLVSKELNFLYPKISDPGVAGFTAGEILQRPLLHGPAQGRLFPGSNYVNIFHGRLAAQTYYSLMRAFLQKPSTIRYLAVGLKGTSKTREATRAAMKEMFYYSAIEMTQPTQPPPEIREGD